MIAIQSDLLSIYLRAIPIPTLSRQMTGIQNTSFAPSSCFILHASRNEKCQCYHRCPRLPPTLSGLNALRAVCLSASPSTRPFYHPSNDATPYCKVSTYSSRPTRPSSPSSSPPFTAEYSQASVCWVTESVRNSYQLEYLYKTFTPELIDDVLSNFHYIFRNGPQAFRALTLHTSPPLPPTPTLSERSTPLPTLRGTRAVFLVQKQFPFELEIEVEVTLTLLINLISGETDAGEPRPGWTRVLAIEIMPVSLYSDAEFMCSTVSGIVALATDGDTSSASSARTFTLLISPLTSRPAPPGVSAQMRDVGVPASE
ncbi:hypothetical protein BGY98DRAFT_1190607 [Russula aff. rugulosa BPL654]|nr:hypothetical protein BGY98DRAFT_1190607 [Russula aff. rugulosa BPL654]